MEKEQKYNLIRICLSTIFLAIIVITKLPNYLCLIPYLIVGYDILIRAFRGIFSRNPFDECFLMTIATFGAILLAKLSTGDYTEAAAVMLFYQIGEWFEDYAVEKTEKNIFDLMDLRPDYANIETCGELNKVSPSTLNIGDVVVINPGEKIPIDGRVIAGSSTIDASAITGESIPVDIFEGSEIYSGTINISGVIKIKVTKLFGEDTASKILALVENASELKSKSENFVTKFSRVYTPVVCLLALALCSIPSLILGHFSTWLYRALSFLVISCPCALVISIPLSFFSGIGRSSRNGILVKGSSYIESLSKVKYILFDKTGTLTKGNFEVIKASEEWLIGLAALCECSSSHPIAESLKRAYGKPLDKNLVSSYREIPGCGVAAKIGEKIVICGNKKIVPNDENIDEVGTIVYVSVDNEYKGYIVISDEIKDNSARTISMLKKLGIKKNIVLSGDNEKAVKGICEQLEIDYYFSGLLPSDKVAKVEEVLENKFEDETVAFVGDGLNDAPVLIRSDIGIAMGALGTDAAIESADIVIMDDDPIKICEAIKISKKCMEIVKQNILFAIIVKILCLILCALGIANMWLAIFADVGVMVIAVINALRV